MSFKLNIYYETLTVNTIEEEVSFAFMDLMSEIGGDLSLYIGITVLSFFELLEFFVRLTYKALDSRKQYK